MNARMSFHSLFLSAALLSSAIYLAPAAQAAATQVPVAADGIGGVVTSAKGTPEAGVWVIAETEDTPTRLIKIVVIDDPKTGWKGKGIWASQGKFPTRHQEGGE